MSENDFETTIRTKPSSEVRYFDNKSCFVVYNNTCPLDCPHCYINANMTNRNTVMATDDLRWLTANFGFNRMIITGGEPTLNRSSHELFLLASQNNENVAVYTNFWGWVDHRKLSATDPREWDSLIYQQLKKKLQEYPGSISFLVGFDEFHIHNDKVAERYKAIVRAVTKLMNDNELACPIWLIYRYKEHVDDEWDALLSEFRITESIDPSRISVSKINGMRDTPLPTSNDSRHINIGRLGMDSSAKGFLVARNEALAGGHLVIPSDNDSRERLASLVETL